MKHLRTLILLATLGTLTLLPTTTSAQTTFRLGLRDGVSLSWLVGIDNTLPQVSFYAGITGDCYFDERWGVGVDVTLAEQGALCKPNSDLVTMDYSFHYLNIPLLALYRLPIGREQHLTLSLGAQAGIFLMGGYDYTAPSVLGEGQVSGSGSFDRDSFHPVDMGVVAALEYGIGRTSIEVRYTLGLSQTHNGISNTLNGYYYISVPDNRNSVLQLGTIVRF